MRDTIARLCADSSDRIPKWLLPVIRANLAPVRPIRLSAAIVASWARYAEGVDEKGEADRGRRPVGRHAGPHRPVAARAIRPPFIENTAVFGDLASQPRFVEAYRWALDSLHRDGARATLEALLQAQKE